MCKNQCEFIDPDSKEVIVTHYYLKDFFLNNKYNLLPKNKFKKNFLIFLHLKLLRKVRIIFSFFFLEKIIFANPSKKNYLILDDVSSKEVENILPKNEYFILASRIELFREIYISKKIIF